MKLLFDTNTIIDFLKQKNPAYDLFSLLQDHDCCTSFIVKLELLKFPDITTVEEHSINELLQFFSIIPYSEDIENETIRLSRATRLRLPDAIIGATAIVNNAEVVTGDPHFLQCRDEKLRTYLLPKKET